MAIEKRVVLTEYRIDVNQAKKALIDIRSSAAKSAKSLSRIEKSSAQAAKGIGALGRQMRFLTGSFAAFLQYKAGSLLVDLADSATDVTARLSGMAVQFDGLGTAAQKNDIIFNQLLSISNKYGLAVDNLAASYVKLGVSIPTLENVELIDSLEIMSGVLARTGASTQQVNAVLLQMSQALGSGALQGDEFRAVYENAPVLLQAWREAIGKSNVAMRELSSTAELTTESFIENREEIRRIYEEMTGNIEVPITVARSLQTLRNEFISLFREIGGQEGTFSGLAQGIVSLSKLIKGLVAPLKFFLDAIGDIITGIVNLGEVAAAEFSVVTTSVNNSESAFSSFLDKIPGFRSQMGELMDPSLFSEWELNWDNFWRLHLPSAVDWVVETIKADLKVIDYDIRNSSEYWTLQIQYFSEQAGLKIAQFVEDTKGFWSYLKDNWKEVLNDLWRSLVTWVNDSLEKLRSFVRDIPFGDMLVGPTGAGAAPVGDLFELGGPEATRTIQDRIQSVEELLGKLENLRNERDKTIEAIYAERDATVAINNVERENNLLISRGADAFSELGNRIRKDAAEAAGTFADENDKVKSSLARTEKGLSSAEQKMQDYADAVRAALSSQQEALSISDAAVNRAVNLLPQIGEAAKAFEVPESVIISVGLLESRFNSLAESTAGARGAMQFMPGTAEDVARKLRDLGYATITATGIQTDMNQALLAGSFYLRELYGKFQDWSLALAAYNAGPGNVKKFGGIPPFKETQKYVENNIKLIKALEQQTKGLATATGSLTSAYDELKKASIGTYESLKEEMDPLYARQKEYNDTLTKLTVEYEEGFITLDQYNEALDYLEKGYNKAVNSANALGLEVKTLDELILESAKTTVSTFQEGLADMFRGGLDKARDFGQQLKDIVLDAVAKLAAQLVTQKLIVPVVANVTGQGGTGSIGDPIGSLGKVFGTMSDGIDGVISGIAGIGTKIKDVFTGGTAAATAAYSDMFGAASLMGKSMGEAAVAGTAAAKAATSAATGISGVLGAVGSALPWVGAGVAVANMFGLFGGSKPKVPGAALGVQGGELTVARAQGLDPGDAEKMQSAMKDMNTALREFAKELGPEAVSAIENWNKSIRNIKAEDISDTLQRWFQQGLEVAVKGIRSSDGAWGNGAVAKYLRRMTEGVNPEQFLAVWRSAEEGLDQLTDTLAVLDYDANRSRESVAGVALSLQDLGYSADSLAALAGYMDELRTPSERMVIVSGRLATLFKEIGVEIPQSESAFKALVDGIDLSTKAGVELAAQLGEAVPLLKDYYALQKEVNTVIDETITTVEDLKWATAELANKYKDLEVVTDEQAKTIDDFIQSIKPPVDQFTAWDWFVGIFEAWGVTVPQTSDALYDLMTSGQLTSGQLLVLAENSNIVTTALGRAADAAQEAARAEEEAARKREQIASERAGLEKQLLQLQGDTAAIRALELKQLDPSNRALQERIWAFEDQAKVFAELEAIAREREGLEKQLLQLQGDTATIRALELKQLDSSNRELQKRIWALEDEQKALEALEAIAREREGLEKQLLQLQGDTATIRAIELEQLDPSNRELQKRIWALEDEQKALEALEAIAREREGLEKQLLQLQGDTAAIRALELEQLDPSNRELQKRIWTLEDEQAIMQEREGLMDQYLQAIGAEDEIRRRQLEKLDPANRALQEQIWVIEDAKAAEDDRIASLEEANQALRDQISPLEEMVSTFESAIESINGAIRGLTLQIFETAQQTQDYAKALLASAAPGSPEFGEAVGLLGQVNPEDYATYEEYQRAVQGNIDYLAAIRDQIADQKTDAEKQIDALNRQIDAQERTIQAIGESANLTVQAIGQLGNSITAAVSDASDAAPAIDATKNYGAGNQMIDQAIKAGLLSVDTLTVEPSVMSVQPQTMNVAPADITVKTKTAEELLADYYSIPPALRGDAPGTGSNRNLSGPLKPGLYDRRYIPPGKQEWTRLFTPQISERATVRELQWLREEIKKDNRQTVQNTKRTSKILSRWNIDGMP